MFETIYSLNLTPQGDGTYVKSPPMAGGSQSWGDLFPLGAPYTDAFRKNRAPMARQLVQELVGTAYACATLNADLVASSKLRLYVRTRPGEIPANSYLHPVALDQKALKRLREDSGVAHYLAGDVTVDEVTCHPLLDLLRRPNPDPNVGGICGFDLRWMTQLYLESVGRAYWLIERDALGVPTQIWLLRSHLVREVGDPSGQRLILAYEYGGNRGARYQPADVVKFHFPDPDHPYYGGYSPLMASYEKIRISRKEDAHINSMLENMGRPDVVWSPKGDSEGGGIGAAEAQRIRTAFKATFTQAGRGGLLVSEFPGTLQPLQWAPQDIVEIERARAIKTDICNVFGVPDAKLERNSANLAGARTADYAHTKDAGIPRCLRSEETLNARLVPMFDPTGRLFVAYDSPVREDEAFLFEQNRAAAESGALTRNEIRASMGFAPVPWGDQPLAPADMVAVDGEGRPVQTVVNANEEKRGKREE